MKTLKSLALVAGMAFVTVAASAQAPAAAPASQAPMTPDQHSQQMAQKMTYGVKSEVAITPAQETQILATEQDFAKGMMAARQSSNGDRDAMRTQMEPLKNTRDAKLKTILTADQYAQYEKAESAHAGGMGGGHKSAN